MTLTTSAGGNIVITGTVDSVSGQSNPLTLNANTGTISIAGDVGAMDAISTLSVTDSASTTFAGTLGAATVVLSDTTGAVTFSGAVTITSALTTAAQGYSVAFDDGGTVAGDTTFANTGGVSFGDDAADVIVFAGGLDTTAGATTAQGTVATTGAQLDIGALSPAGATTLASGGGDITIGAATGSSQFTVTAGAGNIMITSIGHAAAVVANTVVLMGSTVTGDVNVGAANADVGVLAVSGVPVTLTGFVGGDAGLGGVALINLLAGNGTFNGIDLTVGFGGGGNPDPGANATAPSAATVSLAVQVTRGAQIDVVPDIGSSAEALGTTPAQAAFLTDLTEGAAPIDVFGGDYSVVEIAEGAEVAYNGLAYIFEDFWQPFSDLESEQIQVGGCGEGQASVNGGCQNIE